MHLWHPPGLEDTLLMVAASLAEKEALRAFFVHFFPAAFY